MKKTLLLGLAILGATSTNFAQTVLFEDSFEAYADFAYTTGTVGDWTLVDLDLKPSYVLDGSTFPNQGLAKSFIVFNRAGIVPATTSPQTQARTGNKSMACFNASNPAPLVNNDWLISPQVTLGTSGNNVSFWAKALNALYGLEKFNILVSTTNVSTTSFTQVNPSVVITPSLNEWAEYTFNLDAYAGQQVYIAIQCVSDDQFALFVDDFKVTTNTVASADSFFANNFSMYPNPVANELNIVAKTNNTINAISIVDMNGRTVKNSNDAGMNNTSVNVSDLNAGVYFVTIETNEGTGTSKFIKK